MDNSHRVETNTEVPVKHQLEIFQYENELLKEYARALMEELERWKEASKKKATQGIDNLVEAASQFENPLSNHEKEEIICHECGVCNAPNFSLGHNGQITLAIFMKVVKLMLKVK